MRNLFSFSLACTFIIFESCCKNCVKYNSNNSDQVLKNGQDIKIILLWVLRVITLNASSQSSKMVFCIIAH